MNQLLIAQPEYHFWASWLNNKDYRTQEIGDIINLPDPGWKELFEGKKRWS